MSTDKDVSESHLAGCQHRTRRHDMVVSTLAEAARAVYARVQREPRGAKYLAGAYGKGGPDVKYQPTSGNEIILDITIAASSEGLKGAYLTTQPLAKAIQAHNRKIKENSAKARAANVGFKPIVFQATGGMHHDTAAWFTLLGTSRTPTAGSLVRDIKPYQLLSGSGRCHHCTDDSAEYASACRAYSEQPVSAPLAFVPARPRC
jgi:hypothetical protein